MDENIAKIIIAVIGMFGTLLSALISARIVARKKKKEMKEAYRPNKTKEGFVKNTTLIVGLGRVGKTQLIKTITENNIDGQKIYDITNNFRITEHVKHNNGKDKIVHFYTDYRGQNFSQLISSFIEEQLKPNTPLRYGDINTLLLITDLFPQEEGGREELNKKYPTYNKERVEAHINTWNSVALDAVFGLLTRQSLKSVFLFVNKVDKLESYTDEIEKEITKHFKPLIDDLEIRAENSNATFEFIIGSAVSGMKIIGPKSLTAHLDYSALSLKQQ